MAECHKDSIKFMRSFLQQFQYLDGERALEVAAGDGLTTRDLLRDKHEVVDCFD